MNAFGEKSMLIVTALTLGLIIGWLILTDATIPSNSASTPVGAVIEAPADSDRN